MAIIYLLFLLTLLNPCCHPTVKAHSEGVLTPDCDDGGSSGSGIESGSGGNALVVESCSSSPYSTYVDPQQSRSFSPTSSSVFVKSSNILTLLSSNDFTKSSQSIITSPTLVVTLQHPTFSSETSQIIASPHVPVITIMSHGATIISDLTSSDSSLSSMTLSLKPLTLTALTMLPGHGTSGTRVGSPTKTTVGPTTVVQATQTLPEFTSSSSIQITVFELSDMLPNPSTSAPKTTIPEPLSFPTKTTVGSTTVVEHTEVTQTVPEFTSSSSIHITSTLAPEMTTAEPLSFSTQMIVGSTTVIEPTQTIQAMLEITGSSSMQSTLFKPSTTLISNPTTLVRPTLSPVTFTSSTHVSEITFHIASTSVVMISSHLSLTTVTSTPYVTGVHPITISSLASSSAQNLNTLPSSSDPISVLEKITSTPLIVNKSSTVSLKLQLTTPTLTITSTEYMTLSESATASITAKPVIPSETQPPRNITTQFNSSDIANTVPLSSHVASTVDFGGPKTQQATLITETSTMGSSSIAALSSISSVPDVSSGQSSPRTLYTAVGTSVGACISIALTVIIMVVVVVVWRKRRHKFRGTFYMLGDSRRPSTTTYGVYNLSVNLSLSDFDGGLLTTQLSRSSLMSVTPMTPTSPWEMNKSMFDESLDGAYKTSTFKRSKHTCVVKSDNDYQEENSVSHTENLRTFGRNYSLSLSTHDESSEEDNLVDNTQPTAPDNLSDPESNVQNGRPVILCAVSAASVNEGSIGSPNHEQQPSPLKVSTSRSETPERDVDSVFTQSSVKEEENEVAKVAPTLTSNEECAVNAPVVCFDPQNNKGPQNNGEPRDVREPSKDSGPQNNSEYENVGEPHGEKQKDRKPSNDGEPHREKQKDREPWNDGKPHGEKRKDGEPRNDGEPRGEKQKDREPLNDGEPQNDKGHNSNGETQPQSGGEPQNNGEPQSGWEPKDLATQHKQEMHSKESDVMNCNHPIGP